MSDINCQPSRSNYCDRTRRIYTTFPLILVGWEHDALEIWDKQKKTLLEALQQADISLADIAALGITNPKRNGCYVG